MYTVGAIVLVVDLRTDCRAFCANPTLADATANFPSGARMDRSITVALPDQSPSLGQVIWICGFPEHSRQSISDGG